MTGTADPDLYRTPAKEGRSEIRIKGSRFLGFATKAEDEEAAQACIRRVGKTYHDATHVCWAYRLGPEAKGTIRFSDAGEPSGTAGRPIADALEGREIFNAVCVVVRYFGGTKLGTGGLARAYAECATNALHVAGAADRYVTSDIRVSFDYDRTGAVMAQVSAAEGEILRSDYGNGAVVDVRVRRSQAESLVRRIVDATAGRATCELLRRRK